MSNVVNIQDFIQKNSTATSQEDWENSYFNHIEEVQKTPEYFKHTTKLHHLRNLIISMGVAEELVDDLVETAIEKTSLECEIYDFTF